MTKVNVKDMVLAEGVVETITMMAAQEVEGVVSLGEASSFWDRFSEERKGVVVSTDENGDTCLALHLKVKYGYPLPALAAEVRRVVSDAVCSQLGTKPGRIDIYIDSLHFDR